jgi:hypothetical protein
VLVLNTNLKVSIYDCYYILNNFCEIINLTNWSFQVPSKDFLGLSIEVVIGGFVLGNFLKLWKFIVLFCKKTTNIFGSKAFRCLINSRFVLQIFKLILNFCRKYLEKILLKSLNDSHYRVARCWNNFLGSPVFLIIDMRFNSFKFHIEVVIKMSLWKTYSINVKSMIF